MSLYNTPDGTESWHIGQNERGYGHMCGPPEQNPDQLPIEWIQEEIDMYGFWTCACGNVIESDGECSCGLPNPMLEAGLI